MPTWGRMTSCDLKIYISVVDGIGIIGLDRMDRSSSRNLGRLSGLRYYPRIVMKGLRRGGAVVLLHVVEISEMNKHQVVVLAA